MSIKIGSREIGLSTSPLIVAEMSANHNGSLERALEIVDAVAKSGAEALKIQTYTADTITLDVESRDFLIENEQSLWRGEKLFDLYKRASTPWEWHPEIFERARKNNLLVFSSPFDETAVDFLETLDVPCYKIASFELTHLPLIRKVARTGKPIILSTGLAALSEIEEAVNVVREEQDQGLILLKCISAYPANPENFNLKTLATMREIFDVEVGLSDHTLGIGAAIASVALGATVIEKHVMLDKADTGPDSAFSIDPEQLKTLSVEAGVAWATLGKVKFGPEKDEAANMFLRRSIYVTCDIKEGEILSEGNIKVIRPGYGLAPKYYDDVMGRVAKTWLKRGTALRWDLVE